MPGRFINTPANALHHDTEPALSCLNLLNLESLLEQRLPMVMSGEEKQEKKDDNCVLL